MMVPTVKRDRPLVQTLLFPVASRFVAGDSIAGALEAVRSLNAEGLLATIDVLGEDVTDASRADGAQAEYFDLIHQLARSRIKSNISLKLSSFGMALNEDAARERYFTILRAAKEELEDPFVRVDMEGSALVAQTLRVVEAARSEFRNTGPVLQAYLHRTPSDVERMISLQTRVRLCKGAYRERASVALQRMTDIRAQYVASATALIERGVYPAFATHDEELVQALETLVAGRSRAEFEFQMLYGVKPELQRRLVQAGHRVRVYVPFGTHWAQYFRRRVFERKENLLFAIRSAFTH